MAQNALNSARSSKPQVKLPGRQLGKLILDATAERSEMQDRTVNAFLSPSSRVRWQRPPSGRLRRGEAFGGRAAKSGSEPIIASPLPMSATTSSCLVSTTKSFDVGPLLCDRRIFKHGSGCTAWNWYRYGYKMQLSGINVKIVRAGIGHAAR